MKNSRLLASIRTTALDAASGRTKAEPTDMRSKVMA